MIPIIQGPSLRTAPQTFHGSPPRTDLFRRREGISVDGRGDATVRSGRQSGVGGHSPLEQRQRHRAEVDVLDDRPDAPDGTPFGQHRIACGRALRRSVEV